MAAQKNSHDNTQTNKRDSVPIKLYSQNQAGDWTWPAGHSLLTPGNRPEKEKWPLTDVIHPLQTCCIWSKWCFKIENTEKLEDFY